MQNAVQTVEIVLRRRRTSEEEKEEEEEEEEKEEWIRRKKKKKILNISILYNDYNYDYDCDHKKYNCQKEIIN